VQKKGNLVQEKGNLVQKKGNLVQTKLKLFSKTASNFVCFVVIHII